MLTNIDLSFPFSLLLFIFFFLSHSNPLPSAPLNPSTPHRYADIPSSLSVSSLFIFLFSRFLSFLFSWSTFW